MPPPIDSIGRSSLDLAGKRLIAKTLIWAQPHHLAAQLEIICRLMESGGNVAIAVEFLQQPLQLYADEYLAGRLDDAALRRLTHYDRRWGYPFYLYRSILRSRGTAMCR